MRILLFIYIILFSINSFAIELSTANLTILLQFPSCSQCNKRCMDISSCNLAKFCFTKCGKSKFDRDKDNIPCENVCGVKADISFSIATRQLQIPAIKVQETNKIVNADMNLLKTNPIIFVLTKVTSASNTIHSLATFYLRTGILDMPLVEVNNITDIQYYKVNLKLIPNTNPVQFLVNSQ